MNYSDGNEARLGDIIAISGKHRGVVVVSIDRGEYSAEQPAEQWAYLGNGILVNTDFGGLVHYTTTSPSEPIVLVSRANKS